MHQIFWCMYVCNVMWCHVVWFDVMWCGVMYVFNMYIHVRVFYLNGFFHVIFKTTGLVQPFHLQKTGSWMTEGVLNGLFGGRFSDKIGWQIDSESVYQIAWMICDQHICLHFCAHTHYFTNSHVVSPCTPLYNPHIWCDLLLTCLFMD